jgi:hypothetical protein
MNKSLLFSFPQSGKSRKGAIKLLSFMDAILAVFVAFWFGLCVATQLPQDVFQRVRRWDLFHLLPRWSFFAPRPLTSDYHFLYRDSLTDGTHTDWTEVQFSPPRSSLLACLWNPEKRQAKAFCDLVADLMQHQRIHHDEASIQLAVPYLTLLNYVTHLPRSADWTHTQFLIMTSPGTLSTEAPTPLILSGVHQL